MRDLLIHVLQLQLEYSHENTDPMSTRGVVVRQQIPRWIRLHQPQLAPRLGEFADQFDVAGKDGTGRKTLVPWVRIFADGMSPNPQNGWYVVYLFHPDGGAVSLCISHGSTTWDGLTFQPRPAAEAQELMDWSRAEIGEAAKRIGFTQGVRLGSTAQLPRAYERTTAFSKTYPVAAIPDEEGLLADLGHAIELLRGLYDAAAAGLQPRAFQRDVVELNAEINALINPNRRPRGQGFGLNAVQRRAVDARAMAVAREWLEANAFARIRDVSLREPCDYRAQLDGVEKVVEVKGTTGGPFTILLTKGEVDLHRHAFPNNLLLIVHGIQLNGDIANGGEVEAHNPWQVFEEALTATAFRYTFLE